MKSLKIKQQITESNETIQKYFNEISKVPLMSREEEFEVAMRAKSGDIKSCEDLAKANLRFVVSVAKQYVNKDVELMDLISVGNRGLYDSIKKYDPGMGNKFISFAVWYIRSRIIEYLKNCSRTIKIPGFKTDAIRKIKKSVGLLEQQLEREPTFYEIYDEVGSEYGEDELRNLLNYDTISVSSYDYSIYEDGSSMVDNIPSKSESYYTDCIIKEDDNNARIKALLSHLGMKERHILTNYYGIGGEGMTISSICEFWDVSKQSISQSRKKALRRLRNKVNREGLVPRSKIK